MKSWMVFIVAAVVCMAVWMRERVEGAESLSWPSVAGTVTDSRVSKIPSADIQQGMVDSLSFVYTYTVAGKTWQEDRVGIGSGAGTPQEIVARYPKGTPVKVFYNPQHPEKSVLEPGASGAGMWAALGVLCLLIAGWMMIRKPRAAVAGPVAA